MESSCEHEFCKRLERIEAAIQQLRSQPVNKDWYGTEEVAERTGHSPYTVREWCRFGRVRASKRRCGRGNSKEWMISHSELERFKNEGLLPLRKHSA